MILLDTNVISEPLRPKPEQRVVHWLDEQPAEILYLSSITVAELRAGVALLPDGKRRRLLQENLEDLIVPMFTGRILPFDFSCTQAFAEIFSRARQAGLAISAADGYIAAIAATNRLTVATRDTSPFAAAHVPVVNPWEL
ncbi:MAG: type II toxin-antitoxin system VapC family toxin [Desulfobulbus sp.]|jgi:predicted nucleic acid-binding protein